MAQDISNVDAVISSLADLRGLPRWVDATISNLNLPLLRPQFRQLGARAVVIGI
jgi:hypothetical protein